MMAETIQFLIHSLKIHNLAKRTYGNGIMMQDGIYREGRDRRSKYLGIVFGGIMKNALMHE